MITLTGVRKSFGSNHVLRGVNLTLEGGSSMVIIGGSVMVLALVGLAIQKSVQRKRGTQGDQGTGGAPSDQ